MSELADKTWPSFQQCVMYRLFRFCYRQTRFFYSTFYTKARQKWLHRFLAKQLLFVWTVLLKIKNFKQAVSFFVISHSKGRGFFGFPFLYIRKKHDIYLMQEMSPFCVQFRVSNCAANFFGSQSLLFRQVSLPFIIIYIASFELLANTKKN